MHRPTTDRPSAVIILTHDGLDQVTGVTSTPHPRSTVDSPCVPTANPTCHGADATVPCLPRRHPVANAQPRPDDSMRVQPPRSDSFVGCEGPRWTGGVARA